MTSTLPGFGNQLAREAGAWWTTRRWWVQAAVWTVVVNALLFVVLWVIPELDSLAGAAELTVAQGAAQFTGMAAMLGCIGAVLLGQGLLVDERRSGVLEWMLSKPMSRTALLAAKVVGHATALVAVLVVVPWLGCLALLSAAEGTLWPVGRWAGTVALVALLVVFHLSLVLAVSALTWSRALVLAVPLAGLLGSDLLTALVPSAVHWLPWSLARAAGSLLAGAGMGGPGPLVATVVATACCLLVAAWGLHRTEL